MDAVYQETERVSDGWPGENGSVAGNPGGVTEMDDVAERLNKPLYYRVRWPPGRSTLRKGIYTESGIDSDL